MSSRPILSLFVLICLQGLFNPSPVFSVDSPEVAKLFSSQGVVESRKAGSEQWTAIEVGFTFHSNDSVRTASKSRAALLFSDGRLVRLASNSQLAFQASDVQPTRLNLSEGKAFLFGRESSPGPTFDTPTVSTAIRGSEVVIESSAQETRVTVLQGFARSSNTYGAVELASGEQAVTKLGSAPIKSMIVDLENAVQWTIYVPNLSDSDDLRSSKEMLEAGNLITEQMAFGEIEQAQKSLEQFKRRFSASGSASAWYFSLKAIVAVLNSKLAQARGFADQAVQSDSSSVSALLSSAFVAQAEFNLEGARQALLQALTRKPNSLPALSRLIEIEMGLGNLKSARQRLKQAQELAPEDAHVLSLAGFIQLIDLDSAAAKRSFEQAIQRDQSFALPHVGLGLVLMRYAELAESQLEFKKAVHLEPNVGIYRSYLGKAFFEAEQEELALEEYTRALQIDSQDPTPYLYRAFLDLSRNEPVAGLADIEKSIELNNNRAIYRSRMLLDRDLGVRSASLAQIFDALGFGEAARVEAIKSINRDYSNYSAHRLLSESYNSILSNDARLSEIKIAQLLAPLSFNLFQSPQSDLSFNEYSALFDRSLSRTGINASAASEDDLLASQLFHTSKGEDYGYYLAYETAYGRGSKDLNFLRDHRWQSSLQYQLGPDDRLVLSGRAQARDDHDGAPESVSVSEFEDYNLSLGYSHVIDSQSRILADFSYGNEHNKFVGLSDRYVDIIEHSLGEDFSYEDLLLLEEVSRDKLDTFRSGVQYIYDSSLVSVVSGVQAYFADISRREDSAVLQDEAFVFDGLERRIASYQRNDPDSQDAYVYSTWHLAEWIDLGAGLNYTALETEIRDVPPYLEAERSKDRLNPKFGATFYLSDATVLKAAYFETLRKSALEDTESLEPTLVGGINQRFTDLSGGEARNYALGFDHKISAKTYLGAEYIHRDVIETTIGSASEFLFDFDAGVESLSVARGERFDDHQNQDILRSYLYQVLGSRWVSTFDYQYSIFEKTSPDLAQDIESHKAVAALRYFDPSGIFAFTSASWRDQDRLGSFVYDDGSEEFWLVDAGLGYRFPKRRGSLTLKVNNIFDQDFEFDQILGSDEIILSDLNAQLLFSLNF